MQPFLSPPPGVAFKVSPSLLGQETAHAAFPSQANFYLTNHYSHHQYLTEQPGLTHGDVPFQCCGLLLWTLHDLFHHRESFHSSCPTEDAGAFSTDYSLSSSASSSSPRVEPLNLSMNGSTPIVALKRDLEYQDSPLLPYILGDVSCTVMGEEDSLWTMHAGHDALDIVSDDLSVNGSGGEWEDMLSQSSSVSAYSLPASSECHRERSAHTGLQENPECVMNSMGDNTSTEEIRMGRVLRKRKAEIAVPLPPSPPKSVRSSTPSPTAYTIGNGGKQHSDPSHPILIPNGTNSGAYSFGGGFELPVPMMTGGGNMFHSSAYVNAQPLFDAGSMLNFGFISPSMLFNAYPDTCAILPSPPPPPSSQNAGYPLPVDPPKPITTKPASRPRDTSRAKAIGSFLTPHKDGTRRAFACPICQREYKNANGLRYHATHVHRADPRLPAALLLDHAPAEFGRDEEKPYACPLASCRRAYKNLGGVKYHLVNHHPDLMERGVVNMSAKFWATDAPTIFDE